MSVKSRLIPKKRMWICLTIILLPVLTLILLKVTGFNEYSDFRKLSKFVASLSLVGMFLLFMTQWTKDDGDEMHLQFRLISCLQRLIYAIFFLLVMSLFSLFDEKIPFFEATDFSAHSIFFMILLWMLFNLGSNIYKAKKELTKND